MMRDPEAVHLVAQLLDDPQRFALLVDVQRQRIVRVVELSRRFAIPITAIFPRKPSFSRLLTAALNCPLPPSITISCGSGSASSSIRLYRRWITSSIDAKSSGPSTVLMLKCR